MRIREYTAGDFDALRRLHAAQNFGYPLPDLESPLFLAKLVLEDAAEEKEHNKDQAAKAKKDEHEVNEANEAKSANEGNNVNEGNKANEANKRTEAAQATEKYAERDSAPGRVVMAVLLRLTAETYLLHDPAAGTPRQRWQRFLALHQAARESAAARGLDDVQAFLPPRVARSFGRRLQGLGWRHDPWTCFSRRVP